MIHKWIIAAGVIFATLAWVELLGQALLNLLDSGFKHPQPERVHSAAG